MSASSDKQVEVVFALPHRCWRCNVTANVQATAEEIATLSGLVSVCREQTGQMPAAFGIFGRKIAADRIIGSGERLEIYRPLTADPRERRRRRAASR